MNEREEITMNTEFKVKFLNEKFFFASPSRGWLVASISTSWRETFAFSKLAFAEEEKRTDDPEEADFCRVDFVTFYERNSSWNRLVLGHRVRGRGWWAARKRLA